MGMPMTDDLRSNARLAWARAALADPQAWSYADPGSKRRAVRTVLAIRPDWVVPEFVIARRLGRER